MHIRSQLTCKWKNILCRNLSQVNLNTKASSFGNWDLEAQFYPFLLVSLLLVSFLDSGIVLQNQVNKTLGHSYYHFLHKCTNNFSQGDVYNMCLTCEAHQKISLNS